MDLKAQEMMVNIPKVRHVDRVARIELLKVCLCNLKVSLIVKGGLVGCGRWMIRTGKVMRRRGVFYVR